MPRGRKKGSKNRPKAVIEAEKAARERRKEAREKKKQERANISLDFNQCSDTMYYIRDKDTNESLCNVSFNLRTRAEWYAGMMEFVNYIVEEIKNDPEPDQRGEAGISQVEEALLS